MVDTKAVNEIRERLLQSLGTNDSQMVEEILNEYLRSAGSLIEQMEAGMSQANLELVRYAAHTLKSSSYYVGADVLMGLCRQIEEHVRTGSIDTLDDKVRQAVTSYADFAEQASILLQGS